MQIQDYLAPVSTVVFIVIGVFGFGWFRILKETNTLLREQNAELKSENKEWKTKHNENVTKLASMQGQIDVLKSIPLVNIDTTLQEIAKFNKMQAQTNKQILTTLQNSATTLAEDTKAQVEAVKTVKTNLEHSQE